MGSHQYYEQADVDRLLHGGAPELADSKAAERVNAATLRTICQWIDAHPETEFSTDELAARSISPACPAANI
jgi:two-component system response regulator DcuR